MARHARSRHMAGAEREETGGDELEAPIRRYKRFLFDTNDARTKQAIDESITELERQLERLNSRQE